LSGTVFNVRTQTLIGGHQRCKNFDKDWIIVKEPHTDKTGTVSLGYIETPAGRMTYREVDWPEDKEIKANIAANKQGGEFDEILLKEIIKNLKLEDPAEIELMGFDEVEIRSCILLSCHYDIVEWVEPDWVFDTATGQYSGRGLWRRPKFELEIYKTDGSYWPMFEQHHYLKLPRMIACDYFVGAVEDKPVCHIAFSARLDINAMRAARMVVMPEWQGAGIGLLFLNTLSQMHVDGLGRYGDRVKHVYFNTSHPGLCESLRRSEKWLQVSISLYGQNKIKSGRKISAKRVSAPKTGYGGHFRAVQGFKYLGIKNDEAENKNNGCVKTSI
jgi:GNAT superfamily N-acetyltransferase